MSTTDPYKRWELWVKSLTFAAAVFAGIWAVYTYKDTKQEEFYSTFWDKKLELFLQTSASASKMATTTSIEQFNQARTQYWELFFGPLSLVEGPCVKLAMEKFASQVPREPATESTELPQNSLRQPSYRLTRELQKELSRAWENPFSELEIDKSKCVP